jgi:hypothetical protein
MFALLKNGGSRAKAPGRQCSISGALAPFENNRVTTLAIARHKTDSME